jgi:hypothetical protein
VLPGAACVAGGASKTVGAAPAAITAIGVPPGSEDKDLIIFSEDGADGDGGADGCDDGGDGDYGIDGEYGDDGAGFDNEDQGNGVPAAAMQE